ncbi:MAG TPA: type VI secretion system Vgr family protein, partial [Terriglobales bacterium]|nr:type VI secretion system Vgr family protein [Terriglobales bacterium]
MALDDFLGFLQSPKSLTAAHRAVRLHLAFPDGGGNDVLLPQRVTGIESICGGVEYAVFCLSTNGSLPLKEFIALPARIELVTDHGDLRSVCGIVSRASAGNSDGGMASYELVVHDALALLDKRVNTRVFQNVTELEVIQTLHDEWLRINPVLVGSFDLEVDPLLQRHRFPKREMIRQYNESDAHFVQRLLKRRGVSWFIRPGHARTQGRQDGADERPAHTLVLFDDWHSLDRNAAGIVRFHRDSATEKRDTITSWSAVRTLQPGSIARHSWDYRNPRGRQFMTVAARSEADQGTTGNQFAASLDDYVVEAPHVGNDYQDFYSLGQIRLARHDYEKKSFRGEGSVRDFCVGEYFELTGHPEIDKHSKEEREFVITELRVHAVNNLPSELAERAGRLFAGNHWISDRSGVFGATDGVRSRNEFTVVRRGVRLVPEYDPRADLPPTQIESAIVVGPQQEEVHCDRLGRVKVRFPATRAADHKRAAGAGASDTGADS